jgi:serine/threonine-protein kinase
MARAHSITKPYRSSAEIEESRLGNYRMIAQISRGGTATVYLAEHLLTRERVALKVLDPSYARRQELVDQFLQEHAISCAARHPGLVEIKGAHRCDTGVPYIVMELLDGGSLGAIVDRDQVSIGAVISVGMQIAAAVGAMHRAGYIHCDIKPDNVFVLYDETLNGWPKIKVIDFGVARRIDDPGQDEAMLSGTPAYMPPEQWHAEVSPKADVYALGCLMYELLAGEQPFHGALPQIMVQHLEHLPPRPSQVRSTVPAALDRLVMRMLAKDPAMRPTMAEVEIQLAQLVQPSGACDGASGNAIAS